MANTVKFSSLARAYWGDAAAPCPQLLDGGARSRWRSLNGSSHTLLLGTEGSGHHSAMALWGALGMSTTGALSYPTGNGHRMKAQRGAPHQILMHPDLLKRRRKEGANRLVFAVREPVGALLSTMRRHLGPLPDTPLLELNVCMDMLSVLQSSHGVVDCAETFHLSYELLERWPCAHYEPLVAFLGLDKRGRANLWQALLTLNESATASFERDVLEPGNQLAPLTFHAAELMGGAASNARGTQPTHHHVKVYKDMRNLGGKIVTYVSTADVAMLQEDAATWMKQEAVQPCQSKAERAVACAWSFLYYAERHLWERRAMWPFLAPQQRLTQMRGQALCSCRKPVLERRGSRN